MCRTETGWVVALCMGLVGFALAPVAIVAETIQYRQHKGSGLACTRLGAADDIAAGKCRRYCL